MTDKRKMRLWHIILCLIINVTMILSVAMLENVYASEDNQSEIVVEQAEDAVVPDTPETDVTVDDSATINEDETVNESGMADDSEAGDFTEPAVAPEPETEEEPESPKTATRFTLNGIDVTFKNAVVCDSMLDSGMYTGVLRASGLKNSIRIHWNSVPNIDGISGYYILRKDINGDRWRQIATVDKNTTEYEYFALRAPLIFVGAPLVCVIAPTAAIYGWTPPVHIIAPLVAIYFCNIFSRI